jgi:hypothetical protein
VLRVVAVVDFAGLPLRGGAERRITNLTKVVETHSEDWIDAPARPARDATVSQDRGPSAANLVRT